MIVASNNLDNCQFVPIFDELQEITYIKRYYTILMQKYRVLYQVI